MQHCRNSHTCLLSPWCNLCKLYLQFWGSVPPQNPWTGVVRRLSLYRDDVAMFARSLFSRSSVLSSLVHGPQARTPASSVTQQVRHRHQLAPKSTPYPKRHKGIIPVPTGGSTKGTTLAYGEWGIRIRGQGVRLSAKQLTTAEEVIKRKIKVIKGARVWLRVFPDIPVCIKVRQCFMDG
jgi:ribosomal protein L16